MSHIRSFVLIVLSAGLLVISGGRFSAAEPMSEKGKDPSAAAQLVHQALDNEVAGDFEGRRKLLEQALAADSQYPPAHWHLGRVQAGGTWLAVADAMSKSADGELNAQYQAKRAEAGENAALELKLAQWCVKNDMPDRARLHFWRVVANPLASEGQVKDAAKALDLVSVGGMVLTREQLKQEQQREKRIADAIAKYRPILAQLQPIIDGSFDESHDRATQKLAAIDDPEVIPAIETYLHDHQEVFGEAIVERLTKFPQVEATQTLVRFAVVSPYLSVREQSIAELKNRPLHDYVPTLLAGLIAPIQTQYHIHRDARGNIRYRELLSRPGAVADVVQQRDTIFRPLFVAQRRHAHAGQRDLASNPTELLARRSEEISLQLEVATMAERNELLSYVSKLETNFRNERTVEVLQHVSGKQEIQRPQDWWQWWQQYNQVNYPRPTYYVYSQSVQSYIARSVYPSCFVAGTPVWTETGLRPIDEVAAGDRVLSQDPDTGELTFKVVRIKTVTPPSEASQLTLNGETITTTLGHPLWVTGKGWEMAKHVQAGDQLHGIGGIVNVNAIEPLPNKIEAHNLVVDDFNTYFVGNCGMLVHDNTYRKPTRAVVPGLVP